MYRALAEHGLDGVRLFGFDSFEGYPPEAPGEARQSWKGGEDRAELAVAQRLLSQRGIDWARVTLCKGFFDETLTPQQREALRVSRASLINIDCDLYQSAVAALRFVDPLIKDEAVIFFDDWGNDVNFINERRAFIEFLEANPSLHAEELPNYSWCSRVFYLSRGPPAPWQQRMKLIAPPVEKEVMPDPRPRRR